MKGDRDPGFALRQAVYARNNQQWRLKHLLRRNANPNTCNHVSARTAFAEDNQTCALARFFLIGEAINAAVLAVQSRPNQPAWPLRKRQRQSPDTSVEEAAPLEHEILFCLLSLRGWRESFFPCDLRFHQSLNH